MKTTQQYTVIAILFGMTLASQADTVFTDTFSSSTLNPATMSAPTPTSTSYAILADKNALANSSIAANDFKVAMNSTSTGRVEAQARFATSPLTLATTGDYVELSLTFNNTLNLLTLGSSSYLGIGLFNSGGADPVAGGALASSGLSGTADSPYATGNAAGWVGYNARLGINTLASRFYTRPIQNGSGTTSRNQDVIFNESSGYSNPSGVQIGADSTFGAFLTQGNTYTYTFRLTFDAGTGFLNVAENLYAGAGTGGANLFSHSGTTTDSTTPTLSFDSFGFGWKHSVSSGTPSTMDLSRIEVTALITPIPEPTSASLFLVAAGIVFMIRRSRQA
jgi:hypothetical protein